MVSAGHVAAGAGAAGRAEGHAAADGTGGRAEDEMNDEFDDLHQQLAYRRYQRLKPKAATVITPECTPEQADKERRRRRAAAYRKRAKEADPSHPSNTYKEILEAHKAKRTITP